jgi:hypothetical protein
MRQRARLPRISADVILTCPSLPCRAWQRGDSVVTEEAFALGLKVIAALMARDLYLEDFAAGPNERFIELCARCDERIELPFTPGNSADLMRESGPNRAGSMLRPACFSARTATCCLRSGTASRRASWAARARSCGSITTT